MSFEAILFWVTSVLIFELTFINTAVYLLATLLCFLVVLVFFLFWLEFDVLASLLLGVYSSVFIVFFLLLLHFTTFWASALNHKRPDVYFVFVYVFVTILTCLFLFGGYNLITIGYSWSFSFLWQDLFFLKTIASAVLAHILHFFFFRFYIYETILLNFYLLFSLILALGLLAMLSLYVNLKFFSQNSATNITQDNLTPSGFFLNTHTDSVRQVNKFSRQTSRQNSSIIKHK